MRFSEKNSKKRIGKFIGYLALFLIFTTILYFILSFFEKLPKSGGYFFVLFLTISILVVGRCIKYWLSKL